MEEGLSLPIHPQCEVCEAQGGLLRCPGCQVVFYCTKDHQSTDWDAHKTKCMPVKRARTSLDAEESFLRNSERYWWRNFPFETCVGRFGNLRSPGHAQTMTDTRRYLWKRHALIKAFREIDTREGVQTALDHSLDMLRLGRYDCLGVRSFTPSLFLRLGKDQEAYDFIKWWATCDPHGDHHWDDVSLPYLDTHGADVFESVKEVAGAHQFQHDVALTLIKIRLLNDLRRAAAVDIDCFGGRLPQEIIDCIREKTASPVMASNERLMQHLAYGKDLGSYLRRIEKQVMEMLKRVEHRNPYFWVMLTKPEASGDLQSPMWSTGSFEQAHVAIRWQRPAWKETPDALEFIHSMYGASPDEVDIVKQFP